MPSIDQEITAALTGKTDIAREKVVTWIDSAGTNLNTLSMLYRLTGEGYYRIKPELGGEVTCSLIKNYLLECIRQDVKGHEGIEDRWQAVGTLHIWLRHLLQQDGAPSILASVAKGVTELFLESGDEIRNAIETGFLEHALETEALRPYFENWSSDPLLREAWERALEWGKAHPDYTWNLLQTIPRRRDE